MNGGNKTNRTTFFYKIGDNIGIFDKFFKKNKNDKKINSKDEGSGCPGCGFDLSNIFFTSSSEIYRCPFCGTVVTSYLNIIDLRQKEEQYTISEFDLYKNNKFDFSFEYPKGWVEDFSQDTLHIYPSDAKKISIPGQAIISPCITMYMGIVTLAAGNNPRQFYQEFLSKQSKNFNKYIMLWSRIMKLSSGEEALKYSFKFKLGFDDFISISIIVTKTLRTFLMDISLLESQFKYLESGLIKVINSFSFQKSSKETSYMRDLD